MDVASRRDIGMNFHAMQVRRNPTFQSFNKYNTNTSSRKLLKCNYCDGDGHLVDHCYYIIGFLEGHRCHGKNVKPRNKRSMANNTEVVHSATRAVHTATNSKYNTSVPDGPTFTTEEYNHIIAMLRNGNGIGISLKCNIAQTGSHSTIFWIIDSGATDHISHSSPTHNIINAQHASVGLPNGG